MAARVLLSALSFAATVAVAQDSGSSTITSQAASSTATSSSSSEQAQQTGPVPLVQQRFLYPDEVPYKVDPYATGRGPQYGYNICNSSTFGQDSLCQTGFINSVDDWCLWGLPELGTVGEGEGEAVAYCTNPDHGTRLIPEGAITGLQFIETPHYVQVTGRIRQQLVNIEEGDYGGEMDSAGADQRGNPLGGLIYTNAFGENEEGGEYTQVIRWHNFMGGDVFCLKACRQDYEDAWRMCEHIYDRIGCYYNAPANYEEGVFESCLGDDQMYPGYYVGSDGTTSTYTQPPESLGPITSVPYQPETPATSQCTPYVSSELFSNLIGVGLSSASGATPSGESSSLPTLDGGSSSSSGMSSGMSSMSPTGSGADPSATNEQSNADSTGDAGGAAGRISVPALEGGILTNAAVFVVAAALGGAALVI